MNGGLKKRTAAILLMAWVTAPAMAAGLPADDVAIGGRACFAMTAHPYGSVTRLLLELHREQVNPGDEPVVWASVYGEKAGEARPGFNRDGCEPHEPGESAMLDHLRCGFSCDGGTLRIHAVEGGVEIVPEDLYLRGCGLDAETTGGFLLQAADVGGRAKMTPIDDSECRKAMAPGEKAMEDAENAID